MICVLIFTMFPVSVFAENEAGDDPGLYFCSLMMAEDRWTVDLENPMSDWWGFPGSGAPVCFYYGTRSQVQAGNALSLSADDLIFPSYFRVSETKDDERIVPENALDVDILRFDDGQESTEIIYKNDPECKISAHPQLPPVGFFSDTEAVESNFIYEENPFVVTEENRTFYLCVCDPEITCLTGINWNDSALDKIFKVNSVENDTCFEITVEDGAVVPDGWFGAEVSYRYNTETSVGEEDVMNAGVFLKNGQPALMYRSLHWDEDAQVWFEHPEDPYQTTLNISHGNSFPLRFCYGTVESFVPVGLSDLTFDADILNMYEQDGEIWVEGLGFEESGTVTYSDGGTGASVAVNVTIPEIGLYSDTVASKDTYLNGKVEVSGPDSKFYIVAAETSVIRRIEEIQNNSTGEDAGDKFDIIISDDGRYAEVRMVSGGDLPAEGDYSVLAEGNGESFDICFEVTRSDLPRLSTPTELSWHRQYYMDTADETEYDYEDRLGTMSFKAGELTQNCFSVEIYSDADNYSVPVKECYLNMGDMDHSSYFTATDFIYGELPSGTYRFRVRANGDGTVYRNSEWSELSAEWTYTMPSEQLSAPDTDSLIWSKDNGNYFSGWKGTDEPGAGYYEIDWYYNNAGTIERTSVGYFDIRLDDSEYYGVFTSEMPDHLLEEYGIGNIYFKVRAIPYDITEYRLSPWSDFSEPLDVDNITKTLNQKLDDLIDNNDSSDPLTVEKVQNALRNETADLRAAMAADPELSGGNSSGTLGRIQELENSVSDNVAQRVEAKNSAPQQIRDIAEGITMIGATLNLADKNPGSGMTPTVTLELDEPKSGVVIPEQQHNSVQFSMKLNGAVDKDDIEASGQQLIIPVVIDMPVPENINPDFLVILHRLWDGSIEQISPYIYLKEAEDRVYARFVVDSFSDFALVEYKFYFDTASVTKRVGDQPFGCIPLGKAEGSNVSYRSSNPGIASVNKITGEVSIHNTGKVTITAAASATDIYPEAECSYELTIENEPDPMKFDDIKGNEWFVEAVQFVYDRGVMTGYENSNDFGPNDKLTRAQLAIILYRLEGCPEVTYKKLFKDVNDGRYYSDAVIWAAENGIVTGYLGGEKAGCFGPDDYITREQFAVMMYRYCEAIGLNVSSTGDISVFPDAAKVDKWALAAMKWAVATGLISGKTDKDPAYLDPLGNATRAECAMILMRLLTYAEPV
jgi:hypothetical protein